MDESYRPRQFVYGPSPSGVRPVPIRPYTPPALSFGPQVPPPMRPRWQSMLPATVSAAAVPVSGSPSQSLQQLSFPIRDSLIVSTPALRVHPESSASMSASLREAMTELGQWWLRVLADMASASALNTEAASTTNPQEHMLHCIAKFAPSTLSRYFRKWDCWSVFAAAHGSPASAPRPGLLPDRLATQRSRQGLALGQGP